MRQLEQMRKQLLLSRDRYILVPNGMLGVPVSMSRMQKDDEVGNLIDEYYSLLDLATAFGSQYVIMPWVDEFHSLVTWSTLKENEMLLTKQLLKSYDLVDAREGVDKELSVSEVDWVNLPPNAFAVFSMGSLVDVPKMIPNITPEVTP